MTDAPSDPPTRDHGGGLDTAISEYGGHRGDWLDLSTGINPMPYPIPLTSQVGWTALPDQAAQTRLVEAARQFWSVPDHLDILAAPGASALIARVPALFEGQTVAIPAPTYNEHAAAFRHAGWRVVSQGRADAKVLVHPNNPDGRFWSPAEAKNASIIDESFCDVVPSSSYLSQIEGPLILKSFGKFWGLAGLRLGFAIGQPAQIAQLTEALGPWPVAGPALEIGATALQDHTWAADTRNRLALDAARLDDLVVQAGAEIVGGTDLFRLYEVGDAGAWQDRLARVHVWSRIFPYSTRWIRLGLPAPDRWDQLEAALR